MGFIYQPIENYGIRVSAGFANIAPVNLDVFAGVETLQDLNYPANEQYYNGANKTPPGIYRRTLRYPGRTVFVQKIWEIESDVWKGAYYWLPIEGRLNDADWEPLLSAGGGTGVHIQNNLITTTPGSALDAVQGTRLLEFMMTTGDGARLSAMFAKLQSKGFL